MDHSHQLDMRHTIQQTSEQDESNYHTESIPLHTGIKNRAEHNDGV